MEKFEPIAVFGIPRSGTTWFSKALAANGERIYVHEPDNEKVSALGYLAKRNLSRFPTAFEAQGHNEYMGLFNKSLFNKVLPVETMGNKILNKWMGLSAEKIESEIEKYKRDSRSISPSVVKLVESLFGNKKPRVIKTVHASLSLSLLLENFKFQSVILFRHPAAVISSMLSMNMPDADRKIYFKKEFQSQLNDINIKELTQLEKMGLQVSIFYFYLTKCIENYSIQFYFFEDLCTDILPAYQKVYQDLGLDWNDNVENFLTESNKSGQGYKTNRIASKQPDKWKENLSVDDINEIRNGYLMLPQKYYTNDWLK